MPAERLPPIPEDVLDALYTTLVDDDGWPHALERVVAHLGGANGALQTRQLAPVLKASMVTTGVDPSWARDYLEHYYQLDPHLAHAANLAEQRTLFSRDVLPDETFQRSPYFNEFCKPQGIQDLIGVMLLRGDDVAISFASYGASRRRFDEADRARLQQLVPHLVRVVTLGFEQERRRASPAFVSEQPYGSVLLRIDAGQRVHGVVGDVDRWLGDDAPLFSLKAGKLVASSSWRVAFDNALIRASNGESVQLNVGRPLRARAVVCPAASESPLWSGYFFNVMLLPCAAEQAPTLCSLPPSLQRVAALLARGASDKEIALELELSPHSARTYVARVLKKLNVQGRRALMRWPDMRTR